jgi:hypothetical protein
MPNKHPPSKVERVTGHADQVKVAIMALMIAGLGAAERARPISKAGQSGRVAFI